MLTVMPQERTAFAGLKEALREPRNLKVWAVCQSDDGSAPEPNPGASGCDSRTPPGAVILGSSKNQKGA